jgi:hypothetical protein
MYRAITSCVTHPVCPEGDHYWASVDGEGWIEVSRLPGDDEGATVVALFQGTSSVVDGRTVIHTRLRYARRLLVMNDARFSDTPSVGRG